MSRASSNSEDYAPFDDDYRGFDARDEETARGPLILTLAIGVLLIFGAVVWNTYRQGIRPDGEGLPSVLAEETPFKKSPEVAGGVAVPNTDIRFFDEMDASDREPKPETPAQPVELAGAGAVSDGEPAQLRRGPVEPVTELGETVSAAPPTAAAEPIVEAVEAVETVAQPVQEGPRVRYAFSTGGEYLVQIGALRSEEGAETAWKRVTSSAPELYHGATKVIQRVDLGADGVIYRLRVGAFADRSTASAFCDEIKKAGSNCFVVTG